MNIWQAILLGIIQGITEWFPVSSSGHLVLTKHFLGMEPSLFFDVFVHFGSALVVLLIFRDEVRSVIRAFFSSLRDVPELGFQAFFTSGRRKLALFIIIASVPTGLLGILISLYYEGFLSSPTTVGTALIITSIVLWSTKGKDGERKEKDMNVKDGLSVGIMQGLAAVPGLSRSGFTISTALHRDLERSTAARYSFLLFLPAMIGAGLLKAKDMGNQSVSLIPLIAGSATALLVGYITIKLLLKLIDRGQFYIFSPYCLLTGALMILLSL